MIINSFKDKDIQDGYTIIEPVTLAEAKTQCRVDFPDDDAFITSLITFARAIIEEYCHISIVSKIVTLTVESRESLKSNYAQPYQIREAFAQFELPYGPVSAVSSVTSIDSDGFTVESLDLNADYYVTGSKYKTIRISSSYTNSIIVYQTGYDIVPANLKLAILNEIVYRYENRGEGTNIRATAFTEQGVCTAARILADPFIRMTEI